MVACSLSGPTSQRCCYWVRSAHCVPCWTCQIWGLGSGGLHHSCLCPAWRPFGSSCASSQDRWPFERRLGWSSGAQNLSHSLIDSDSCASHHHLHYHRIAYSLSYLSFLFSPEVFRHLEAGVHNHLARFQLIRHHSISQRWNCYCWCAYFEQRGLCCAYWPWGYSYWRMPSSCLLMR